MLPSLCYLPAAPADGDEVIDTLAINQLLAHIVWGPEEGLSTALEAPCHFLVLTQQNSTLHLPGRGTKQLGHCNGTNRRSNMGSCKLCIKVRL